MANPKLQYVKISDIIIGDRFRKDLKNIDTLASSIKEKGVLQPITINTNKELMAGGRRIEAAKRAGLETIPALIRPVGEAEFAEIDLREVELIENTFREDFTWQERAALVAELDRLMKEKHGSEWGTRKTAALLGQSHPMNVVRANQIQEAMAIPVLGEEVAKCKTADEAIKLVKKFEESLVTSELRRRQETIKDSGMKDVLKVADSNYRVGDALRGMEEIPRTFAGADFIEVDPPYGIDLNEQKKQTDSTNIVKTYNEVDRAEYEAFIQIVAEQTFKVAAKNCWMIFWYGPTHHAMIFNALTKAGWSVDEIPAIWVKGTGQTNAPEVHLARAYEPFFVCRKGQPILHKRGRSNVFEFAPVPATKKYHPTERPLALMAEIYEVFTFEGGNQTAIIPFLGSGVSLRAAYLRGLRAFGWDLNGEYKDKFMLAVQADTEALNKSETE